MERKISWQRNKIARFPEKLSHAAPRLLQVGIAFLLTFLLACEKNGEGENAKNGSENKDDKAKVDRRVPVETAQVISGPISARVSAFANLEAESQIEVLSRSANLVAKLLVEEGDQVKRGQLLLQLDNEEQRIALEKAKATFAKEQKEFEQQTTLLKRKLLSEQLYATSKHRFNQSKLDRDKAQLQYDYTFVKAPIDGIITKRLVNLGAKVNVNTKLFEIIDFNTIVARVHLPEEHLGRLQKGLRADIASPSMTSTAFSGEVLRVAPIVDASTGTVKVTVGLSPHQALRPGMYVSISLVLEQTLSAVLVPKKALVYDDEQTYIYQLQGDKVKRLPIDIEIEDLQYVKPAGGVDVGDLVVIAGQHGLKDRTRVRVVNEDASPSAELAGGEEQAPTAQAELATRGDAPEGEEASGAASKARRAEMREKLKNMTPEEREDFKRKRKEQMKKRREQKDIEEVKINNQGSDEAMAKAEV